MTAVQFFRYIFRSDPLLKNFHNRFVFLDSELYPFRCYREVLRTFAMKVVIGSLLRILDFLLQNLLAPLLRRYFSQSVTVRWLLGFLVTSLSAPMLGRLC